VAAWENGSEPRTIGIKWRQIFTGKWTELENNILSDVRQAQKAKSHMFSLIYGI
jgi:hypothetical protein